MKSCTLGIVWTAIGLIYIPILGYMMQTHQIMAQTAAACVIIHLGSLTLLSIFYTDKQCLQCKVLNHTCKGCD